MELGCLICDDEFSHQAKKGNIQILMHDILLLSIENKKDSWNMYEELKNL